jgi:hypothetical protein
MRPRLLAVLLCGVWCLGRPGAVLAQQREPRIGPFVVDLHVVLPKFPSDPQLADSRGLNQAELPGLGLGLSGGVHVYLLRWRAITFGIGAEAMTGRSHYTPAAAQEQQGLQAVTERLTSYAPQLSFNFGTGRGWSYISGGIGQSIWSIVPDGQPERTVDKDRLRTVDYGGGARWFAKKHLAFSFDVRFYQIDPGFAELGFPGSPRTTLLVMGAGVSVK